MNNLWEWIQYLFGRQKADEKNDASRFDALEARVTKLEATIGSLSDANDLAEMTSILKKHTESLEESERKAV